MDQELKELDLATIEARSRANDALDGLRKPQAALTSAAVDFMESVIRNRVDAARRDSVPVMARLSDDDVTELRFWVNEQVDLARSRIEAEIESCDFWIPETSGLSPNDVNAYGAALVPRPKDSKTGIPQTLVFLFERCFASVRDGLMAVGLAVPPAEAEPRLEIALLRAWRTYRELALECLMRWADVDERYHVSSARFQEMRWENAGKADVSSLEALRKAEATPPAESSVEPATLPEPPGADVDIAESDADNDVQPRPESLVPANG